MAESIAVNGQVDFGVNGRYRTLRLLCTADETDGSFDLAIPDDAMAFIGGWILERILTKPGGTAPTDASDLTLTDPEEATADLLATEGADIIDATSTLITVLTAPVPLYAAHVLHVANNIVNSAIFEIVLICRSV